ncbi:hypothetical protein PGB90_002295 [Kerria lacca]
MLHLEIRGQTKRYLDVADHATISEIKEIICKLDNIPVTEILFYNGGTPLQKDDMLILDLPNLVLDLSIPLLGGKVHGSLARAGKVKGQTPKVEKQDKKKTRTGRAKRRMQYNRRFVNVIQTFGRRRGPNANS